MSSSSVSVAKGTGAGQSLELGAPILSTTRVVMGAGVDGPAETTVGEVEGQRPRQTKAELEAEFWERVRGKATAKAAALLAQARAEAAQLKMQAQEQGYQEGMQAASADFEAHIQSMSQAFGQTLATLQAGRASLWRQFGGELTALVHMAVAKAVGVTLSERRGEILAHLLDEALEQLEAKSALTVRVNPADEEAMGELLARARQADPGLSAWRIRGEEGLSPGSILLECGDGLVDNRLDSRLQAVQAVLDKLSLDDAVGDETQAASWGPEHGEEHLQGPADEAFASHVPPEQAAAAQSPEHQAYDAQGYDPQAYDPLVPDPAAHAAGDAAMQDIDFAGHEAAEAFLSAQSPFGHEDPLAGGEPDDDRLPQLADWQPPEGFDPGQGGQS